MLTETGDDVSFKKLCSFGSEQNSPPVDPKKESSAVVSEQNSCPIYNLSLDDLDQDFDRQEQTPATTTPLEFFLSQNDAYRNADNEKKVLYDLLFKEDLKRKIIDTHHNVLKEILINTESILSIFKDIELTIPTKFFEHELAANRSFCDYTYFRVREYPGIDKDPVLLQLHGIKLYLKMLILLHKRTQTYCKYSDISYPKGGIFYTLVNHSNLHTLFNFPEAVLYYTHNWVEKDEIPAHLIARTYLKEIGIIPCLLGCFRASPLDTRKIREIDLLTGKPSGFIQEKLLGRPIERMIYASVEVIVKNETLEGLREKMFRAFYSNPYLILQDRCDQLHITVEGIPDLLNLFDLKTESEAIKRVDKKIELCDASKSQALSFLIIQKDLLEMGHLYTELLLQNFMDLNFPLRITAKKIEIFRRYKEENAAIMVVIIWDGVPQKFCYGEPHSTLFSIKGSSDQLKKIEAKVREIVKKYDNLIRTVGNLTTTKNIELKLV